MAIKDVTEATFAADVVEASRTRPVVVDFWAAWCGPCHQLSPILERVAQRHVGEVDLVKVDVDRAPNLSRQFRVQGIPAVKAFRDSRLVAEFVGVQPERVVEQFFAALAPSEADRLVAQARAATDGEREPLLRKALDSDPDHPGAVVALATLLGERGERDAALQLLERIPGDPEAQRLVAELQLAAAGGTAGSLEALHAAAEDGDPAAVLAYGQALAAAGEHDHAVTVLLRAVAQSDTRDAAREALVAMFTLLGDDHPLVKATRPKLAAALF